MQKLDFFLSFWFIFLLFIDTLSPWNLQQSLAILKPNVESSKLLDKQIKKSKLFQMQPKVEGFIVQRFVSFSFGGIKRIGPICLVVCVFSPPLWYIKSDWWWPKIASLEKICNFHGHQQKIFLVSSTNNSLGWSYSL